MSGEKQIEELSKKLRAYAYDLRLDDNDDCRRVAEFVVETLNYRKMDEVTLKLDLGDRTPEEIKDIMEKFNSAISDKPIMAIPTSKEVEELCKKEMCEELKSLQRVFNGRAKEYTNWDGNKVQAVTLDWINADIDETIADIINGENE